MTVEIRDESTGGDLVLASYVEGTRTATARAEADILEQMRVQLFRQVGHDRVQQFLRFSHGLAD